MKERSVLLFFSTVMMVAFCNLSGTRCIAQNYLWHHAFGGTDYDYPGGVYVDQQCNTYFTGTSFSPTFNAGPLSVSVGYDNTYFMLKLDPSGNPVLLRKPHSGKFHGIHIQTDSKGNIYLMASYFHYAWLIANQTLPIPHQSEKGILVKYDPAGNILWYHTLLDEMYGNIGLGLTIAGDNNFIAAGCGSDTLYHQQSYSGWASQMNIRGLDSLGVVQWYRSFHTPYNNYASNKMIFGSMKLGLDNRIYLTGGKNHDTLLQNRNFFAVSHYNHFVLCFNHSGNVIRRYFVPSTDVFRVRDMVADSSGNTFLYGSFTSATFQLGGLPVSYNSDTNGFWENPELFLAKFDPSGNPVWLRTMKSYTGPLVHKVNGQILLDSSGNIYINGSFPGPSMELENIILPGNGSQGRTGFILKYDGSGNLLYHLTSSGTPGIFFRFALAGEDDFVVVSEVLPGEGLFGNVSVNAFGGYQDIFAGRFSMTTNVKEAAIVQVDLKIFPNPVSDDLFVQYSNAFGNDPLMLRITDMQGRELERQLFLSQETPIVISCSHLVPGVYLLHVSNNCIEETRKFLVVR